MDRELRSIPFFSSLLPVALLLAGCATAPHFSAGEAILKGETSVLPTPPDSLRAGLDLTAFGGGRKSTVSAALSAKPARAYKLDLFGLPGMVSGSFLWTPEKWSLVLFDREQYVEGSGEHVEIGNLGLREVSVHDLFSFLWGDFFPGVDRRADPGLKGAIGIPRDLRREGEGVFAYPGRDILWRVVLDPRTGQVREVMRGDSAFRISYADYRLMGGNGVKGADGSVVSKPSPMPRRIRLYRYRDLVLEIRLNTLETDPLWRRDPFFIKIPKGFRQVDRGEGALGE